MSQASPPNYMMPALKIAELIETALAERPFILPALEAFPRDMSKIASYGFEIPVVSLPNLTLQSAKRYLCMLGGLPRKPKTETRERELFGLLHIGPPSNLILLDARLSVHWANYVIAHEVGHFFGDLVVVRQQWLTYLPNQRQEILKAFAWQPHDDMLDLQALIRGLFPRPRPILERGHAELIETDARERQADLVARELLAPWRIVSSLASQHSVADLATLLNEKFGLPRHIARYYAADLRYDYDKPADLIDRLFAPFDTPDPSSR